MSPNKEEIFTFSESYTWDMPKHVYLQVKGVEKSIKLKADKVERQTTTGSTVRVILSISLQGNPVGEFSVDSVDGWWIQDDEPRNV